MEQAPRRKGAVRRSGIPADILKALNEGGEETITLVEWLAIDMRSLLRSVLPDIGLLEAAGELDKAADRLASKGVTERLRGIGKAVFLATKSHPTRVEIFESLASHMSDMVRAWAAFTLAANRDLFLTDCDDVSEPSRLGPDPRADWP